MSDWQEKALANEARANELEEKLQKLTKLIRQNQESGLLVSRFGNGSFWLSAD